MGFEAVEDAMHEAVERGVFPGAVLLVREGERVFYLRAFGERQVEPHHAPMQEGTIFDLSSLTKPLATGVAIMLLVRDGKLHPDDRVTRFLHNFGVYGKTHVTMRHLLNHSSGLPAWRPYYKEILQIERKGEKVNFLGSDAAKEYVYQQISRERPESPAGAKTVYSDLGFMLLGMHLEARTVEFLEVMFQTQIAQPLGVGVGFFPSGECAPTEDDLRGKVHDENARALGGVAGHAGLFGHARDVAAIARALLGAWAGESACFAPEIVRRFWSPSEVPGSTWCLGWDRPSPSGSSAGERWPRAGVGHLGFTGCSLWLDPPRGRGVVLLSNRVHPTRANERIKEFRPRLHDAVVRALDD